MQRDAALLHNGEFNPLNYVRNGGRPHPRLVLKCARISPLLRCTVTRLRRLAESAADKRIQGQLFTLYSKVDMDATSWSFVKDTN